MDLLIESSIKLHGDKTAAAPYFFFLSILSFALSAELDNLDLATPCTFMSSGPYSQPPPTTSTTLQALYYTTRHGATPLVLVLVLELVLVLVYTPGAVVGAGAATGAGAGAGAGVDPWCSGRGWCWCWCRPLVQWSVLVLV